VKQDVVLTVLRETRLLLARPENNFAWSSWTDAESALREIDGLIASVSSGSLSDLHQLSVLFAPTGPLQEVSIDSGWGDTFLELAERIDAAMR
jgi:hypothetical protein